MPICAYARPTVMVCYFCEAGDEETACFNCTLRAHPVPASWINYNAIWFQQYNFTAVKFCWEENVKPLRAYARIYLLSWPKGDRLRETWIIMAFSTFMSFFFFSCSEVIVSQDRVYREIIVEFSRCNYWIHVRCAITLTRVTSVTWVNMGYTSATM